MPALVVLYLLLCLLVGFVGRNRKIGFAGFFVLSVLLSPLVMALVYLLGTPRTSP